MGIGTTYIEQAAQRTTHIHGVSLTGTASLKEAQRITNKDSLSVPGFL